MTSKKGVLVTWEARDGVDPLVHFALTERGVSRITGKGWSRAKKVGKGLGSLIMLAGLLTGRTTYGPAALSLHYLTQKSKDVEFMHWKDIRKVAVNKNDTIISLRDKENFEIRLHCTPETFDPALGIIRQHATFVQNDETTTF
jgi:hypothetical protein